MNSTKLLLLSLYPFLAGLLVLHIIETEVGKSIRVDESVYYSGSDKQRWTEGMLHCLDRKAKVVQLECVIEYTRRR